MQSVICLVLGTVVLVGSVLRRPMWRATVAILALAALLAFTLVSRFPLGSFTMGDGSNIVQQRDSFDELVHHNGEIRFSAHLAYHLLDRIDAALGATDTSPLESYRALSWLAAALLAISLIALAAIEHWNPQTVRYIALVMMAPATLMYFGYIEVGYLALSGAAFAFVARDLSKGGEFSPSLLVGAVLFGLGAALHGIGYLGIAAMCAAVMAADLPIARRLLLAAALGAIAVGTALIWLYYYLAVGGYAIVPYHAIGGALWRGFLETRVAEGRIVYPLLSTRTARDLFLECLISGGFLLPVALLLRKQWAREARLVLGFTVPCLIFYVFLWPPQGIGIEMDMVIAAFPAIFPLLWICSHSRRASVAGAGLLAIGHWAFWHVVHDGRFINEMLN